MITIKEDKLQDFGFSGKVEWLETNGLGGYSSSTLSGCNTRRYHGLLVAATNPPTERTVLVSKMDETIVMEGNKIELGTNVYNDAISPNGYSYLKEFSKDLFPQWTYKVGNILLRKSIIQPHKHNTTLIRYEVLEAEIPFQLQFQPFLIARDYHGTGRANEDLHWDCNFANGLFHNKPFGGDLDIFIKVPGSSYTHHPEWYFNFKHEEELLRGLGYNEDLLCYGTFEISVKAGDIFFISLSTENPEHLDPSKAFEEEITRRFNLLSITKRNDFTDQLILAADQFIVQRPIFTKGILNPIEGATIIAGYHWFTDWGRDTMISLPGLCISTKRFEEAKKILNAFAQSVDMGMLPNFFSDKNGLAEFNNVDGTLWFFQAVYHYYLATQDKEFVLNAIFPVLENILEWHYKGTRYNIHRDTNDHLLYEGEKGQQLTWMDARIGDWVVTPRMGKPVEIEALWYNAHKILSFLAKEAGFTHKSEILDHEAANIADSFIKTFWFEEGNYLYDSIDENNTPVNTFRPNQLFAISLPFELLGKDPSKHILDKVKSILYTPVGLRSLPQNDPNYNGFYGGDQYKRDSNYHQGAVWGWLMGPYIDALVKVETPKEEIKKVLEDFQYHLFEGGIGTVSEIFDGDFPHSPKGCIAQAWSVAEILRVILAYNLLEE